MSDLTDDRIDDPVDEPTEMPVPSTGARVWRRIIRRPMNWLNSPWPAERIAHGLALRIDQTRRRSDRLDPGLRQNRRDGVPVVGSCNDDGIQRLVIEQPPQVADRDAAVRWYREYLDGCDATPAAPATPRPATPAGSPSAPWCWRCSSGARS